MQIFDDEIDVHHGSIPVLSVPAPGSPDPTDEQVFEESYEAEAPQAGWYRVRCCAAEMDAGNEEDETAPIATCFSRGRQHGPTSATRDDVMGNARPDNHIS